MFRSARADFQLRVQTLSAANDPPDSESANQRFWCAPEVLLCSRREPTSNLKLQTSNLLGKKRVVLFLLAHCGHRTVTGADDGFVRQGENFLEVVLYGIAIRDVAAAHRAGEQ